MLLFLTREALWRRSIEERRVGEGEPDRPYRLLFSALMESKLRFCQKTRGEVALLLSSGDDWNGEESVLIFCVLPSVPASPVACLRPGRGKEGALTLLGWVQLGEFLL